MSNKLSDEDYDNDDDVADDEIDFSYNHKKKKESKIQK